MSPYAVPPARTPRYSYDVPRDRWCLTPGIASAYIHHLPDWLATVNAPAIVLWCRESKDNGHLPQHRTRATAALRALGIIPVSIFADIANGDIRGCSYKLELAIDTARQLIAAGRPAALVAEATDRFIRPSNYGVIKRMMGQKTDADALADGWVRAGAGQSNVGRLARVSLPRIDELELLDDLAAGVPLCTMLPPDTSSRSAFTADGIATARAARRRGQYQHWTDDDAEAVQRLARAGQSGRQIARLLNMPEPTVRRLKRGGR